MTVYFNYIQFSYQLNISFPDKIIYYYSYINFSSSLFLCIRYLLQKKKIIGFIYVFFIIVFLTIFYTIIKPKKKIKFHKNYIYLCDTQIFYHLITLINTINDNIYNFRENIYDIINFYSLIIESKNEFKLNSLEQKEEFKNKEIKNFLLKYIEHIFKKAISENVNSILLRAQYAHFLKNNLNKYNTAYIEIYSLYEEMENNDISFSFCQQFYIYRVKKHLEEKCLECGTDKNQISIKFQINYFMKLISQVSRMYYEFWSLLLYSKQYQDVKRLDDYGKKINSVVREIDKLYQSLSFMKLKNRFIFLIYSYYLRDILNEEQNAEKIYNKELILGTTNDDIIFEEFEDFDINDIKPSSNLQFLIVNANENETFANIIKISPDFSKKLGFTFEQIYGKNLNLIVPSFLREEHNKILKEYFLKNKFYLNDINISKSILQKLIYFKTSSIYISPIFINVYVILDEDYNLYMMAKIDSEKEIFYNQLLINVCHILTNNQFFVQNFTPNCLEILNIKGNMINVDLLNYIKELKEIKFNYLINHPKKQEGLSNKIRKYLYDNHFFSEKKRIIWKLKNQCFKVCCKEINMNKKIVGYIFLFELEKEEYHSSKEIFKCETPKLNSINSIPIIRKNEKEENTLNEHSLLKKETITLNKNFIKINPSFIPEKDKIIDFNINTNEFTFNTKSSFISNAMNFGKILEYYHKINNEKMNNNINEENEISSEYEESNSSFSSEESSSDLEDKEKEKINTGLTKISTDKMQDNYYKVNLKKITLFGYDYISNSVVEIYNYVNKSRVNEIYEIEKEKTLKLINKNKKKKENILNKKFTINVGKLLIAPEIKKLNQKKINKNQINFSNSISKERLNKSVVLLIFANLFYIIIFCIFPFMFFIKFNKDRILFYNLSSLCFNLHNLIDYSGEIFYYAFQVSILKNEKYINLNPSSETLINLSKARIYNKYYLILDLLKNLSSHSSYLSKKNKEKKDNFTIKLVTVTKNLGFYIQNVPAINFIEEYSSSVFVFATTLSSKSTLLTQNFFTILTNLQMFFSGDFLPYQNLYHDQYKEDYKAIKLKFIIFLLIISVFILSSISFLYIANKKVIFEKEKHIKYFFKITPDKLENMIEKCNKFMKLNLGINNDPRENISNPKFNINNFNNDEEENSLITEENHSNSSEKKNNSPKEKKKDFKQIKKFNESKFIKYHIEAIKILFLYILIISLFIYMVVYLQIYSSKQYISILNYIDLYEILINMKLLVSRYFIYLRLYIVFSSSFQSIPTIQGIYLILEKELPNSIINNKYYIEEIINNITKNKFPIKIIKKVNDTVENSLCSYLDDYINNYNINYNEVGNNICKYGLISITIYILQSMMELLKLTKYNIDLGKNKNYTYSELFYGTDYYIDYHPENKSLWEEYESLDPFNIINNYLMKNLSVLIENVHTASISSILEFIEKDFNNSFNKIKMTIIVFSICFYILFVFIIFLYIIPYILRKNVEINKKRKMLILIPKDILPEIIEEKKEL